MTFGTVRVFQIWIGSFAVQSDARFKVWGFVGWLAIAMPVFVDIRAGTLGGLRAVAWVAAFAVFGISYAIYLRPHGGGPRGRALTLVIVLAAAAFTMVLCSVGLSKYLTSVALTIVASELPYLFAPRGVWAWIVVQSALLSAIFWLSFGWVAGVAGGLAYTGFQVLALGRTWLELKERAARVELAHANAELRATQALLAASAREAERVRIARDLHDSLGHHLTALSIQLEIASLRSDGPAAPHVRQAHMLARLLLSDIRVVVAQLRDHGEVPVSEALRALSDVHGRPRVHVAAPDGLLLSSGQANALLRCAQELITNARRHAAADNVWIDVSCEDGGVVLDARDDGRGGSGAVAGHGLVGMRERFAELGGSVEIATEGVFRVRGFIPGVESAP